MGFLKPYLRNIAAPAIESLRDGGITIDGIPVSTDVRGLALLNTARYWLQANPTESVAFIVSALVSMTLNKTQIDEMWHQVTSFIQDTYTAEKNIWDGIAAGTITNKTHIDAVLDAVSKVR